MGNQKRFVYLGLVIIWCFTIFIFSHQPGEKTKKPVILYRVQLMKILAVGEIGEYLFEKEPIFLNTRFWLFW